MPRRKQCFWNELQPLCRIRTFSLESFHATSSFNIVSVLGRPFYIILHNIEGGKKTFKNTDVRLLYNYTNL